MKLRRAFLAVLALVVATGCSRTSNPTSTTATSVERTSTTQDSALPSTSTTIPVGVEELPESLQREVALLIPLTEQLRELTFLEPPMIEVITTEELTQRVIEQVEEEYENPEVDEALYRLLGLVPADFDLVANLTRLYGEQVAGYYDGDTKTMVVTARNDEFSPLEEATLVHELTHALTDQHHEFNAHFEELFDTDQFDRGSAFQAVIEGDASLVETLFAQQLTPQEQQEFLEEAFSIDTSIFDSVPQFIQDSLVFPYDAGVSFTQSIWLNGGFPALDELYQQPPVSTEQIYTPDDLVTDPPQPVSIPELAIPGYELDYSSTWGELGFRLIFDQVLGGAGSAVEGWGGDDYDVFFNGSEVVLVLLYQGDADNDAAQMADALRDYFSVVSGISEPEDDPGPGGGAVYQGDDYAFISTVGRQVLLVAASDPGTGATARSSFPGF